MLDAMQPLFGAAARAAGAESVVPSRLLAIETNQGLLAKNFVPQQAGRGNELSPYLKMLEAHRDDFTVFSGVSHPGVEGGTMPSAPRRQPPGPRATRNLAGGGFKHGQHLVFDKTNNTPLANIYVSMLQRLGIAADTFSTSKGTMRGLELV